MKAVARILCAIDLEKASERAYERALNRAVIGDAEAAGVKVHVEEQHDDKRTCCCTRP